MKGQDVRTPGMGRRVSGDEHAIKVQERLEKFLLRLIDISRRNRSLYFSVSDRVLARCIPLREDILYEVLDEDGGSAQLLAVNVDDWSVVSGSDRFIDREAVEKELKITDDQDLVDLVNRMMWRDRERRSETGSGSVYLIYGLLLWREPEGRRQHGTGNEGKQVVGSPLFIARCSISARPRRREGRKIYEVTLDEDGFRLNPALRVYLQKLYEIDLKETIGRRSGGLAGDEEYFTSVEELNRAIDALEDAFKGRWFFQGVKRRCWFAMLGFPDMAIYYDAMELRGEMLKHPVIRAICGDTTAAPREPPSNDDPEPYELDGLLTPLPADESQVRVIRRALRGENLVVHGPPGTGKSQTIANLLVMLAAEGKRALFVVEKKDAADVVISRLRGAGLDLPVLEVLSTSREDRDRVLEDLIRTIDLLLGEGRHTLRETATGPPPLPGNVYGRYSEYLALVSGNEMRHDLAIASKALLEKREKVQVLRQLLAEHGRDTVRRWFEEQKYSAAILSAFELREETGQRTLDPALFQTVAWLRSRLGLEQNPSAEELSLAISYLASSMRLLNWLQGQRSVGECVKLLNVVTDGLKVKLSIRKLQRALELTRQILELDGKIDHLSQEVKDIDELMMRLFPRGLISRIKTILLGHRHLAQWAHELRRYGIEPDTARNEIKRQLYYQRDRTLSELEYASNLREELVNELRQLLGHAVDKMPTIELERALRRLLDGRERALEALGFEPSPDGEDELLAYAQQFFDTELDLQGLAKRLGDLRGFLQWLIDAEAVRKDLVLPELLDRTVIVLEDLAESDSFGIQLQRLLDLAGVIADREFSRFVDRLLENFGSFDELTEVWESIVAYERSGNKLRRALVSLLSEVREGPKGAMQKLIGYYDGLYTHGDGQRLGEGRSVALAALALRSKVIHTIRLNLGLRTLPGGPRLFKGPIMRLRELAAHQLKIRRRRPLVRIMRDHLNEILLVKPVLIMTPLMVSTLLRGLKGQLFDVVVFDEASQVQTERALPAIARGRQVIVVGDEQQMPPTDYFTRRIEQQEDEEGEEIETPEGLLEACLNTNSSGFRVFGEEWLRWYYRGEHESLIAFSNAYFYDNRLVVYPSADPNDRRVRFFFVENGNYISKTGVNPNEAAVVLWRLIEAVKSKEYKSILIVAMNERQQDAIKGLIEDYKAQSQSDRRGPMDRERLRAFRYAKHLTVPLPYREREVADLIDEMEEDGRLLVRNLETVQGREADLVIISMTYGPVEGVVRKTFGPINNEGGERRINVLISRARKMLWVVSSMKYDMIRVNDNDPRGVRVLRDFLEYAERGGASHPHIEPFDSPFEEEVFKRLQAALTNEGLNKEVELVPQVGVGRYRIDIGVLHNGRFILGIECDGRLYHSHRTARERDWIRQRHLERLGWRIYRIWSSEWWINPEGVIEDVLMHIREAVANGALTKN
ncbi:MAG: AAA domain-containing protein [Nitrososphaerota archaeon]